MAVSSSTNEGLLSISAIICCEFCHLSSNQSIDVTWPLRLCTRLCWLCQLWWMGSTWVRGPPLGTLPASAVCCYACWWNSNSWLHFPHDYKTLNHIPYVITFSEVALFNISKIKITITITEQKRPKLTPGTKTFKRHGKKRSEKETTSVGAWKDSDSHMQKQRRTHRQIDKQKDTCRALRSHTDLNTEVDPHASTSKQKHTSAHINAHTQINGDTKTCRHINKTICIEKDKKAETIIDTNINWGAKP